MRVELVIVFMLMEKYLDAAVCTCVCVCVCVCVCERERERERERLSWVRRVLIVCMFIVLSE